MTDEQKRKAKAAIKHIEVAQRALNCVDVDCLREDTADGDEYASEMFVRWESVQYGLDDLRDYFQIKLYDVYDADDTD